MKNFWSWFKIIIIVYCIGGIAIFYFQDKFLFHPVKLDTSFVYNYPDKSEEIFIPVNSTDTIHVLRLHPKGKAKGAVIYFHGNTGNNSNYYSSAKIFLEKDMEVWIPDYPTFGKTSGELTEGKIKEQAIQVERLVSSAFAPHKVILYGQSFGTGVASYIASETACKFLILESPYADIPSLFRRYAFMYPLNNMVKYKFPVIDYLPNVTEPIIIFHGTADNVILIKEAQKLKKVLKPIDKFYELEGINHNEVNRSLKYISIMDSMLSI
ncbi:MAG: alpha/beta fold hydrolase [Ferruginibacter sp.]